jgi:hypothetical protein
MTGTPSPMTDLSALLTGPMAEANLTKLLRACEDEVGNLKRKMAAGLSNEEYVKAAKHTFALINAQIVLKSIQTYHTF